LSEQPAGPYVNRRIDLSPLCVSSLQQQTTLSVLAKDTSRPTVQIEAFLTYQAEDKRNSRRSPLPSFTLTLRGPCVSERQHHQPQLHLHPITHAQTTSSTKPPSLPPTTTNSRHSQPCFSVSPRYCRINTQHTPLLNLNSPTLPRPSTASLLTAAPGLVFFIHNNPSFTHLDSISAQHGRQPGSRRHSLAWYVFLCACKSHASSNGDGNSPLTSQNRCPDSLDR
jgi:hypothetical protein